MTKLYVAPVQNFLSKTLSGGIDNSQTTITLSSTTNMQAPGYVIIDRVNSDGVATPTLREVISYTGISGSNLTGCTRGQDGSTAQTHNDTAVIETALTTGMWNSLATIIDNAMDNNSYLKAINSPVSIAIGQFKTIALSSIASIPQVNIGSILSISGASLNGFPPQLSAAAVYLAGAATATVSLETKIPFDTKEYDAGTEFDVVTNHRFTAALPGKYLVTASANLQMADAKQFATKIYKNGAAIKIGWTNSGGSTNQTAIATAILSLAAGDYLEFYVLNNDAADRTIIAGQTVTHASIIRLS